MRVLIAALAEHASVSQPGDRLNVNCVFDRILAPKFPFSMPLIVVALRLQLEYEDRAEHALEVVIVTQDGKEFTKFQTNIEVEDIEPGRRVVINYLVFLQRLKFDAPERFSVSVRWDTHEEQRFPLDVALQEAPPATD